MKALYNDWIFSLAHGAKPTLWDRAFCRALYQHPTKWALMWALHGYGDWMNAWTVAQAAGRTK